jgi:hypothetical protein
MILFRHADDDETSPAVFVTLRAAGFFGGSSVSLGMIGR